MFVKARKETFFRAELPWVPNMYMDLRKLQRMQTEAQSGPNTQTDAWRSLRSWIFQTKFLGFVGLKPFKTSKSMSSKKSMSSASLSWY